MQVSSWYVIFPTRHREKKHDPKQITKYALIDRTWNLTRIIREEKKLISLEHWEKRIKMEMHEFDYLRLSAVNQQTMKKWDYESNFKMHLISLCCLRSSILQKKKKERMPFLSVLRFIFHFDYNHTTQQQQQPENRLLEISFHAERWDETGCNARGQKPHLCTTI